MKLKNMERRSYMDLSAGAAAIWFAWDGGSSAVLGWAGLHHFGDTPRSPIIVVAHSGSDLRDSSVRSGNIVDFFQMELRRDACRPLRLPRETHAVEILEHRADGELKPIRAFALIREEQGTLEPRATNLITMKLQVEDTQGVSCEHIESVGEGILSEEDDHHAWVLSYQVFAGPSVDADREATPSSNTSVTRIGPARVVIPRNVGSIKIIPKPNSLEPTGAAYSDVDDHIPAILAQRLFVSRYNGVSFDITVRPPGSSLHGILVLLCRRQLAWANAHSDELPEAPELSETFVRELVDLYREGVAGLGKDEAVAPEILLETLKNDACDISDVFFEQLNETGGSGTFSFPFAVPGDHLVFADTLMRRMEDGNGYVAQQWNPVLAFRVTTRTLERMDDDYKISSPILSQLKFRTRPVAVNAGGQTAIAPLKPKFENWLASFGAPIEHRNFVPLLAKAAELEAVLNVTNRDAWDSFKVDPTAVLIARTVFGSTASVAPKPASSETHAVVRALNAAGYGDRLKIGAGLDAQIEAALLLLEVERHPELRLLLERVSGLDLAQHDTSEIFKQLNDINALLAEDGFASNLANKDTPVITSFIHRGVPKWPVPADQLAETLRVLVSEHSDFVAFKKKWPTDRDAFVPMVSDSTPGAAFIKLKALIQALNQSNEPNKLQRAREAESFLSMPGSNDEKAAIVFQSLLTQFPELTDITGRQLDEIERALYVWAGVSGDRLAFDNGVHQSSDLPQVATDLAQLLKDEISSLPEDQIQDPGRLAELHRLVPLVTLQRTRQACNLIVKQAADNHVVVPPHLEKSLRLWPKRARTTWQEFETFANAHSNMLSATLEDARRLPDLPNSQ